MKTTNKKLQELVGRMTAFLDLVPGGKWQRGFLIAAIENDTKPHQEKVIKLTYLHQLQLTWWKAAMTLNREWWFIKHNRKMFPSKTLHLHTDASGAHAKAGYGGVWWLENGPRPWFMNLWPSWMNEGKKNSYGKSFDHSLSTLESTAICAGICSEPDLVRGAQITSFCDNAGSVATFSSGQASDLFLYVINKAIADVVAGLDARIEVVKTRRISCPGDQTADFLSKQDLKSAKKVWGEGRKIKSTVPAPLIQWIQNPTLDYNLGKKLLENIGSKGLKYVEIFSPDKSPSEEEEAGVKRWYRSILDKQAYKDAKRKRKKESSGAEEPQKKKRKTK